MRARATTTCRYILVSALFTSALFVPGKSHLSKAGADSTVLIRYATLAPLNSTFGKVLKAWGRSLKTKTEGRVELRFYSGGSQGDERDFIRKIRAGQIDAAGITSTGMGMVVRPILVLTVPGLLTEYEQLHRVRELLRGRLEQLFRRAGFELLTWGDGGKNRLFSTRPFERPADLKKSRPWAWKDDPVFTAYLKAIGANPVRVGAMEVYPGLQTRMIDVVSASAIAAVAFQWYTRLHYITNSNLNIIIGGSIVKKAKFLELSPKDQRTLKETAEQASRSLDTIVVRDDRRAYDLLRKRGLQEVDMTPYRSEWDAVAKKTRERLVGRVYSASLLKAVEAASQRTRPD